MWEHFIAELNKVEWIRDFFVTRLIPTTLGVFLGIYLNGRIERRRKDSKGKALLGALERETAHNSTLLTQILTDLQSMRFTYNLDLSVITGTAWEQIDLISEHGLLQEIQEARFELIHISRQVDSQMNWPEPARTAVATALGLLVQQNQARIQNLAVRIQGVLDGPRRRFWFW